MNYFTFYFMWKILVTVCNILLHEKNKNISEALIIYYFYVKENILLQLIIHLVLERKGKKMLYLMTHSTHFIYGYMVSDIWLRTILIVREETCCCHIGYSLRLTARVLLYAPSHKQDSTYLCYTSRGALSGTRNSSMDRPMSERSYHGATSCSL